ncbi:peptidylprolyl isomerase [Geminicoccaceae bacterium 1502E]|nr:peptidylprolyl isomerase [Geminicoccaceae bacterium 1502E]
MEVFAIGRRQAEAATPLLVRVNGVVIPPAAIAREIQHHPASSPAEARRAAVEALVVRELLLQEARLLGLDPAPAEDDEGRRETEEEALVRRLVEQAVAVPKAEDSECRRFYDTNPGQFRSPAIFEASHILFSASRRDEHAFAEALRLAEAAIAELWAAPQRFEELARSLSACPSAASGGNLGQISAGQVTPEFEEALAGLAVGQITPEPVTTPYGVHVIRLTRRIDGGPVPFEAVRERIAAWLEERVWRRAVAQYVRILAGRAVIEGCRLDGAETPLVQ